jgi:hypothetical protein
MQLIEHIADFLFRRLLTIIPSFFAVNAAGILAWKIATQWRGASAGARFRAIRTEVIWIGISLLTAACLVFAGLVNSDLFLMVVLILAAAGSIGVGSIVLLFIGFRRIPGKTMGLIVLIALTVSIALGTSAGAGL